MFSFEEIKEVLNKHSYKELIEDYRLRQRYNSFKNDEITEDVITLLPISSYLLPFDIHDSLSLYIACLRFRNDVKKLKIVKEILDKYHFGGILADDMGLRKNNTNVICNSRLFKK